MYRSAQPPLLLICLVMTLVAVSMADPTTKPLISGPLTPEQAAAAAKTLAADKAALAPLQHLVGEWKGVGLPKRGSNVGAWGEQGAWAWHFTAGHAGLHAKFKDGKYFSEWHLAPTEQAQRYRLTGTLPDGKTTETWTAELDDQGLLTAQLDPLPMTPAADRPVRMSIKTLAMNDRQVILYERQAGQAFTRLAEVGSTRVGGNFAAGAAGPECIVTGGLGTIEVSYQGQKYYVCCTGCKAAFDEDPATIIAEYKAKLAAKQK